MKRFLLYIIIFAALCHIADSKIDYTIGKHIENQTPIHLSFSSIGANLLESRLDCWATIKVDTSTDLEDILGNILKILDLKYDSRNANYRIHGNKNILQYESTNNDDKLSLFLELNPESEEVILYLTVLSKRDLNSLFDYEQKIQKEVEIKAYYLLTGVINHQIDYESKYNLIQVVMKHLNAKEINVFKDGRVISVTGYSNSLENIRSEKDSQNEYNVQIAMRNSSKENKTYIYLGFPLILGEY